MRAGFSLWHGFALSIALHLGAILPFMAPLHLPEPERPRTLVVELQGQITDRQLDAKQIDRKQTEQPRPETPPPEKEHEDPPKPDTIPVKAKPAPPRPKAPPQPTSAPPAPSPVTNSGNAAEQQPQQTIRYDTVDPAVLNAYLRTLKKRLQDNLVYSEEAKKLGLQGTATISFMLTQGGDLREETLRVVKSSGFPKLDTNALATVRSSVPFEPPPKEMTIAIAIVFVMRN